MNEFNEDIALSEYKMTPDLILAGERVEIDPDPKPKLRKEKYVRHDFAVGIINAYADDLYDAYKKLETLNEEVESLREKLNDAERIATTSTAQLKQLLSSNDEFTAAEKLLAKVENQIETFVREKKADEQTIQQLRGQIEELIELRDTVPQLRADVEAVLDNLKTYFAEEGIIIDEDDDDL